MSENLGQFQLTQPVQLVYCHLFKARAFKRDGKEQGDPKFGASLLMKPDHPDFNTIKETVARVAHAKWPGRDLKEIVKPWVNGTKKADEAKIKGREQDARRGHWVIAAHSKSQPKLAVRVNNAPLDLFSDEQQSRYGSHFYDGVEAFVSLNFVAYEPVGRGLPGVTAYLQSLASLNRGARISMGAAASDLYKGYQGSVTQEDPTGGMGIDEEIPF